MQYKERSSRKKSVDYIFWPSSLGTSWNFWHFRAVLKLFNMREFLTAYVCKTVLLNWLYTLSLPSAQVHTLLI